MRAVIAESKNAPPPVKVPIGECLGKTVKCPDCGKPAEVFEARGGGLSARPVSSIFWVKVHCKGHCGTKLHKIGVMAEPLDLPPEAPKQRMLSEAVGRVIRCPTCGGRAQAAHDGKTGHEIRCGLCQSRPCGPETVVEVLS